MTRLEAFVRLQEAHIKAGEPTEMARASTKADMGAFYAGEMELEKLATYVMSHEYRPAELLRNLKKVWGVGE